MVPSVFTPQNRAVELGAGEVRVGLRVFAVDLVIFWVVEDLVADFDFCACFSADARVLGGEEAGRCVIGARVASFQGVSLWLAGEHGDDSEGLLVGSPDVQFGALVVEVLNSPMRVDAGTVDVLYLL